MSPLPYASLDEIRQAIRARRAVSFRHKDQAILLEPYALVLSPRYGAFVLIGRVIAENRIEFYRYAEIRGLQVTEEGFSVVSADFNHTDRRIGTIDTSIPRRAKQCI